MVSNETRWTLGQRDGRINIKCNLFMKLITVEVKTVYNVLIFILSFHLISLDN